MSADELAAAVAELGALPMPVPVVPEPLTAEREAEIREWVEAMGRKKDIRYYGSWQQHGELLGEIDRLRTQVAELLAERHVTNEALDDAVQALRATPSGKCGRELSTGKPCPDHPRPGVPPKTVFRASHDSIVMGLYDSRQAAMDHVHATLGNEEGGDVTARVIWRADDPEADEPTWECWLFDADMADDSPTGYVVEPLEVASAYDPDADE